MGFIKRKHRPEYAAVQREWAMWVKQMEKTLPGYGEQNEALHWMVRILTGVRVLYCLFYLIMSFFGLLLLCVLSCYIGMLWIGPYMNTTLTLFYLDLRGELPEADSNHFH